MKRKLEVVLGISLACIFIVAIVIPVTFGGSGIDLSSIQPTVAEVEVGSTCTYNITLFSFEGNWFKITIITDTCDPNWFEWLERGPIRLGEGETKQMSLNVTPSKAGDFNFTVRAEAWLFGEAFSEIDARVIATGQSKKPCCTCLMPDKSEPQVGGTAITWTACSNYPDQDQLRYKFWVYDGGWNVGRDWARSNSWTWTPSDTGDYDIKVEVCDGRDSTVSVGNATYWEYSITVSAQKPMAF